MRLRLLATVLFFALAGSVLAQSGESAPRQLFVTRDVELGGADRLTFVEVLTGAERAVTVSGERYTPLGDSVLFYDRSTARVKIARADGSVSDHPFVQLQDGARRIDWVVSPDGKLLAWTVTSGSASTLMTTTTVAGVDGANLRQLLVDGPRDGIRAFPVAFSPDNEQLYMDYQPDSIGDLTPFRQYAGLFSVDLSDSSVAMLPNEPGCFCGAGIGADRFLRLALTDDLTGYNVRVFDLNAGTGTTIPALTLVGFTQAGDVLISPDGSRAVYALAQVRGFGSADQSVRTVFVLVDLATQSQRALTEPITTFVRPVAWTEDNSAILFTSPSLDGTWKVSLSDGTLDKVANATYVGVVE